MIKNELNGRSRGRTMNILESFEYDENNRLVKWTNLVTTGVQKVIDHMLGRFILMTPIIQMQINQDNIYQPTSL